MAAERVPLIRQINRALANKADHSMPEDFFHDLLDEHFSEEETDRQIETAVNWGRYAELFDRDAPPAASSFPKKRRSRRAMKAAATDVVPRNCPARSFASAIGPRWWIVLVFAAVLAGIYAACSPRCRYWMGVVTPAAHISRSPAALPAYAFYSLVRMGVAYLLSLVFAVAYGYIAAYNRRVETVMMAVLDILQSIPVLSFLPGVMLAMVALFPTRQLGVELGSIVLIFTGQVWNMAFSFYSSLKSIPRELREAAAIYRFSATGSALWSWSFRSAPSAWCGTPSFRWPADGSS